MAIVIALCGMPGSGKSTVSGYIKNKLDFTLFKLGITEEAIKIYGKTSEEIEKKLRVDIRKKHGMGAMAIISIDSMLKIHNSRKNIIIDNMYSWSEYKIFRENFGENFKTIAIHASPSTRYVRLHNRVDNRNYKDPLVCKSRDYSEIEELEKGGPIAMADFHIVNEAEEETLLNEIDKVLLNLNIK